MGIYWLWYGAPPPPPPPQPLQATSFTPPDLLPSTMYRVDKATSTTTEPRVVCYTSAKTHLLCISVTLLFLEPEADNQFTMS